MNTNVKPNPKWIATNGLKEIVNSRKLWLILSCCTICGLAVVALSEIGPMATTAWTLGVYVCGIFADAKPNIDPEQEVAWALLYCGLITGILGTLLCLLTA